MKVVITDGGRREAGFRGACGDCVVRAIAVVTQHNYAEIYRAIALINSKGRRGVKSARNGTRTRTAWFERYMGALGFKWTPTMRIGGGCTVHLHDGELPMGRLVVRLSKHVTAVIDGVIHDAFDPQREATVGEPDTGRPLRRGEWRNENGICRIERRCVYGYWTLNP